MCPARPSHSLHGFEFALHGLDHSGLTSQQKVNAIGVIEAFVSSAARVHHNAATAELRTGLSTEESFEFRLRCLLDGLEALVDSRQDGAAPDR